jgi:ATP-dependent DNA helicase DinG
MALDRDLLLARAWERPGRTVWLAVDLAGAGRILELPAPGRTPSESPGAILVAGGGLECAALTCGGLLVPEDVFWSILDPRGAEALGPGELGRDRIVAEADLRAAARRFGARLRWWRSLGPGLPATCRELTAGFEPSLDPLWDWLAAAPVPPAEAAAPAPAAPGPDGVGSPAADPDGVYAWLNDPEGLGALYGDHWQARIEQAEMGREVASALADGQPLMIEAGTGVGKTLAYLTALVAWVVGRGTRAVVSTHTRALQSQILDQDLPRLRPLLENRRYALLMGRRNYLCLRQRQGFLTRPLENLQDALAAVCFRLWLTLTRDGLRDELAGHPVLAGRQAELFDAADLCLPGACYEPDACFVQAARRRARDADLLVVNHSLLLADGNQGGNLIGPVDHLVIDEAHRLPAAALDAHSVAVGAWRMTEMAELLGRIRNGEPERAALTAERLKGLGREGERAAAACLEFGRAAARGVRAFEDWWRALGALADGILNPADRQGRVRVRDKDEAFAALRTETAALLEVLADGTGALGRLAGRVEGIEEPGPALQDDLAQLAQAGQMLRALHHDVHFLTTDPDEDWVTWVEPGPRRGLRRLGATLLEAGGVLRDLWQASEVRPVVTSATLAVGEDFTHMMQELGLTRRRPPTRTRTCPSPFDYHEQSLILTPSRFPDPSSPQFNRAVGEVIRDVAHGLGRKTMGLFTSYRAIREAAGILEAAPGAGGPSAPVVLMQSPHGGAGALLEQFRARERAVLLGTATFWEGVDFPGEALEILVVAKLPFLVPNDPWVEARCERLAAAGENPFTAFMVRDAVLRLRQGFGRLIRRSTDRGVVIILDGRLHTKNYGTTFLGALPVMPVPFGDTPDLLDRIDGFFRRR